MLNEPAVARTFFGRENILRVLEKRALALKDGYRQNVALTGPMLSGKSSILFQFFYSLKDPSFVPIYIEVVKESFPSFASRFIANLLFGYFSSCGYTSEKSPEELIKKAEASIPHTTRYIKKVKQELQKRRYTDAYRMMLELTSILKQETGKSCIIIFDEFHNLEHFKIKKPYLHFGKIIMIQKDTMYIVSSSQKNTFSKILSEELALLYGNFEIIEVSGFDVKTSGDFMKEKLGAIKASDMHIEYLADFTDGNPFYMDIIAKKMRELASTESLDTINEEILVEALTSLLHNTSGTINQYLTNSIMNLLDQDLREGHLEVLIALANGYNKLKDIAFWLGKKNTVGLSEKLKSLMEIDVVYKNGVFYVIQDKVFAFWLKAVYHQKRKVLIEDIVNRSGDFVLCVKKDILNYASECDKDITKRVEDLFTLFKGDMVEIAKKTRKLPKFISIERKEYGKRDELTAFQKKDKYWIFDICRERIDESTISDILKSHQSEKDKITKKVCIALEGIDRNALLLAKEKNVWIWSLKSLNKLLRLYKKQGIVYK